MITDAYEIFASEAISEFPGNLEYDTPQGMYDNRYDYPARTGAIEISLSTS